MRSLAFLPALVLGTVVLTGCGGRTLHDGDVDSLLKKGAQMVSTFSFFEAEPPLRRARELSPLGSESWQEASYLLALALRHQTPVRAGRIEESRRLLEELLAADPKSRFAPDALMVLARIDELRNFPGDRADAAAAAEKYRRLVESYPDSDLADLAVLRLAVQGTMDPEDKEAARRAVAMLEEWITARPDSPYAWAFWEYISSIQLLLLHDRPAALRAMIEADNRSRLAEGRRGNAFWNIATLAEELGDWETAERYFKRMWERTPRNQRRTEAGERLATLRGKRGDRS